RSGRSRGHLVERRPRRRERPVLPSGSWGTPPYRERLPQRGVTQGGRETFGEKGLSGLQAGHGALKVRALFGIVQDGGIAVTDPPQDGDDRVHIIGHLPADGITTPFCISLRSPGDQPVGRQSKRGYDDSRAVLPGLPARPAPRSAIQP